MNDDLTEHLEISDELRNKRHNKYRRSECFNISITNARSLAPKVKSVIEAFDCLDLDCMTITETWLFEGDNKLLTG